MPDEPDSWLEGLGVSFDFSDEDSSAAATAEVSSGNAPAPVSGLDSAAEQDPADVSAPDASDAEQNVPTDITGGPGDSDGSTLTMDPPIGVLQLLSSAPADAAGRKFSVTVASSVKDALLFAASVSGASVGTVKISQPSGTTTLQNVLITAISTSGSASDVAMTLESPPPKKKRAGGLTLVMDPPIGALPLLSVTPADSAGKSFNVIVGSSAKDALLLAASASGTSVGTVKISTAALDITLRNAQISSISISGAASNVAMRLDSPQPAEISSD